MEHDELSEILMKSKGQCVGCPYSKDSWCLLHRRWAYMMGECDEKDNGR